MLCPFMPRWWSRVASFIIGLALLNSACHTEHHEEGEQDASLTPSDLARQDASADTRVVPQKDRGEDSVETPYLPVRCEPISADHCGGASHELPIPTHYNHSVGGFHFMSADAAPLYINNPMGQGYVQGQCYHVYESEFIPDTDHYYGDIFATTKITNDAAIDWAGDACRDAGVRFRHLWPPAPNGASPGVGPASQTCDAQAIHGVVASNSLYTVLLPPSWSSDAPEGTYPIVFCGLYDVHGNTFSPSGRQLARAVAASGLNGGRGVIGVLWNGGGHGSTLTCNAAAHQAFAEIIGDVSQRYRGNREWIVTFGGSRGGYTALSMAANIYFQDYRVVAALATVPPTLMGEFFENASSTYPGTISVLGGAIGLADAWRAGFRYPSCAGRPHLEGLKGWQAALRVMCGTSDPAAANDWNSPASDRYLTGLAAAGTQVYVELGEHDIFVPFSQLVRFHRGLLAYGVPTRARMMVRAGHSCLATSGDLAHCDMFDVVSNVVARLSDPALDLGGPVPSLIAPGFDAFRVNRSTQQLEPLALAEGEIPFSFEVPAVFVPGHDAILSLVGPPGTEFTLEWRFGAGSLTEYSSVIPVSLHETIRIPIAEDHPEGEYHWGLEIKKPGAPRVRIPSTNTPTGDPCVTRVLSAEPVTDASHAALEFIGPVLVNSFPYTSWGLSEH